MFDCIPVVLQLQEEVSEVEMDVLGQSGVFSLYALLNGRVKLR